jgi:hypothetical protein
MLLSFRKTLFDINVKAFICFTDSFLQEAQDLDIERAHSKIGEAVANLERGQKQYTKAQVTKSNFSKSEVQWQEPARLSFHMMRCWAHPKVTSVASKTRSTPRSVPRFKTQGKV